MSKVSHREGKLVVCGPDVFDAVVRQLEGRSPGGDSLLDVSPPSHAKALPFMVDRVTDVDVNGDGYSDAVESRAYRIGYGNEAEPYRWVSFTSIYFGTPSGRKSDEPDMVDAAVQFEKPAAGKWEISVAHMMSRMDAAHEMENVTASAVDLMIDFVYGSLGNLYVISSSRADLAGFMIELEDGIVLDLRGELAPFAPAVRRAAEHEFAPTRSCRLWKVYREIVAKDPEGRSEVYDRWTNPTRIGGELLHDDLYEEFLKKVELEKDPKFEAEFLRKKAHFLDEQRRSGGLFDAGPEGPVAKANALAVAAGHSNYAEMVLRELHGISSAEFKDDAISRLEKLRPRVEAMMKRIKGSIAPGRPVWEFNVLEFMNRMQAKALKAIGVGKEPTLSPKEAVAAVKAMFKDMGFDLDALPDGKRVVFDLQDRRGKDGRETQTTSSGASVHVVTLNLGPRICMVGLQKMVHEAAHAVHSSFVQASRHPSYFGGTESASRSFTEAVAMGFEKVVMSKQFMDRYLSGYAEFKDAKVRDVMAAVRAEQWAFWEAVVSMRALWEMGLYENASSSMDERLDFWGKLGIEYLGYDDVGIPTSKASFLNTEYAHPGYWPLSYLAYTVRSKRVDDIADRLTDIIGREGVRSAADASWLHRELSQEVCR